MGKEGKRENELLGLPGKQIIGYCKVDYILFFGSIGKLKKEMEKLEKHNICVMDLSLCYSIDWLSNDEICSFLGNMCKGDKFVVLLGKPKNLRVEKLKMEYPSKFKAVECYGEGIEEIKRIVV
jgi:hypothetical protein